MIGVSAGDLQAFRRAAKLASLSAEDMTSSLKSLGRTIEDATYGRNQDALVMMSKFGIALHKTKDGAVDATRALKDVANAIVAQKGNVQAQAIVANTPLASSHCWRGCRRAGRGIAECHIMDRSLDWLRPSRHPGLCSIDSKAYFLRRRQRPTPWASFLMAEGY